MPTKILSDEHQNILKVIEALTRKCELLESGQELNEFFFKKAIDFIRNYADKFHHAKEEDILFKELNKDGIEMPCNPTEQMLHEHNLGRDFVKGMENGLNKNNKSEVIKNARGYVDLLKDHIYKEDNILYPMADEALNQQTKELILVQFEQAEKERFSQGTKEKYLSIVEEFGK